MCLLTTCLHFLLAEPNPKVLEQEPINRSPYNLPSQIKEGAGEHGVWIRLDTQIKASTPALLKLMTVLHWAGLEPTTKQGNVIIWLSGSKTLLFFSYWDFCSLSIWKIWNTAMSFPLSTTVVNSPLLSTSARVIIISVLDYTGFCCVFGDVCLFCASIEKDCSQTQWEKHVRRSYMHKTWVECYASEQSRLFILFSLPERFVLDYMRNLRDGLIFKLMLLKPHGWR